MKFETTEAFAQKLDQEDALKGFRTQFLFPEHKGQKAIYFLGNSLGLQPKSARDCVHQVLDQWQQFGVQGFAEGEQPWMNYHDQLLDPLSRIVGGLPHELVVMNSLTVNIHLMLASFYQPHGRRKKIICEAKAFCSDQYALETHLKKLGLDPDEVLIEIAPDEGSFFISEQKFIDAINAHAEELALVFIGGVNYYTGQVFDMKMITAAAHAVGAKAGFDLAHAAGNVELHLHDWDIDFACWCNYKYLNSGPGAIGGAYIHERYHSNSSMPRLAGWWGYNKATRFQMQKGFDPVLTAEGWQVSTPPAVLYALHYAALRVFDEAGMSALVRKGQLLSDYLMYLIANINSSSAQKAIQVITPEKEKGCQVSMLMLQKGKEIFDQLRGSGIYADWREPDVIRVAPVPLYNTFQEVWHFAQIIHSLTR